MIVRFQLLRVNIFVLGDDKNRWWWYHFQGLCLCLSISFFVCLFWCIWEKTCDVQPHPWFWVGLYHWGPWDGILCFQSIIKCKPSWYYYAIMSSTSIILLSSMRFHGQIATIIWSTHLSSWITQWNINHSSDSRFLNPLYPSILDD